MKVTLITLVCVATVAGESARARAHSNLLAWRDFKKEHDKVYTDPAEETLRFANFMTNKQFVKRHNADPSANFTMRLNHMADWSSDEIAKLNGFRCEGEFERLTHEQLEQLLNSNDPAPDEVDWRKVDGRVTGVKNQSQCGSCWAFATTGLLEGQEKLRNLTSMVALSEQELVDCSKSNKGCEGGYMAAALDDVAIKLGGIQSEEDYPYEGVQGKCRFDKSKIVFSDKGHKMLPQADEDALKKVVASYGPVAAAIQATAYTTSYSSGILNDPSCTKQLNHAVLVVGYGSHPQEGDFWIVKNSWGEHWGEAGYLRMRRGINQCGIAEMPTIADF